MTKTTAKRLERMARRVLGRKASEQAVRELAAKVAESLAERRQPKTPPEWVGCR